MLGESLDVFRRPLRSLGRSDYEVDQIHGREEIEAAGGQVVALPFVGVASTTTLIERMQKGAKR